MSHARTCNSSDDPNRSHVCTARSLPTRLCCFCVDSSNAVSENLILTSQMSTDRKSTKSQYADVRSPYVGLASPRPPSECPTGRSLGRSYTVDQRTYCWNNPGYFVSLCTPPLTLFLPERFCFDGRLKHLCDFSDIGFLNNLFYYILYIYINRTEIGTASISILLLQFLLRCVCDVLNSVLLV